ncbi:VacJ family lipoprotein [Vibrio sp. JC009]|uniref:MlaA family lipoprotein n=1 Tax=Vibrio sp. JC009 TaxID=2912314 RepID=UPI0023B197F0|nr:VacJ family lipoprotein [Vibrio sp. JC009]WED21029.1 VacJ family lipoprotein [Vibrio sp. JC009]
MKLSSLKILSATLLLSVITGCSSAPDAQDVEASEDHSTDVSDPFEGFNRSMWSFNHDVLDPYVVRPVSLAYVNYTPKPVRTGISNVLSNLDEPSSMVNNLLMGNGKQALNNFNRFWINSTFGIFGLIDLAGAAGIPKEGDRSFGDALGHAGVGNGPYLMIPAYGPATTRDVADTVDTMYFPLSYLNFWTALGKWTFQGMESRAALVSQEPMLDASPDSYIFTRDAYIQYSNYKAEVEPEEVFDEDEEDYLDDYMDELE